MQLRNKSTTLTNAVAVRLDTKTEAKTNLWHIWKIKKRAKRGVEQKR